MSVPYCRGCGETCTTILCSARCAATVIDRARWLGASISGRWMILGMVSLGLTTLAAALFAMLTLGAHPVYYGLCIAAVPMVLAGQVGGAFIGDRREAKAAAPHPLTTPHSRQFIGGLTVAESNEGQRHVRDTARRRYGGTLLAHLGKTPPRFAVGDTLRDDSGNEVIVTKIDPPEASEPGYSGNFTLTVEDDI